MTTPTGNQPTRPSAAKRYGPLVGIVLVIAVVAAAVTLAGRKDTTDTATGTTAPPATAKPSDVPVPYDQAQKAGTTGSTTWVDNCDPATGRIKMPSNYAPPCVPKFTGDNGGATGTGVTADKITVVNYVPADNNDVISKLSANLDPKESVRATEAAYTEMLSNLFQTYGRKVEIVNFEAKGAANDATAAQADAVNVIEKYHPFASLGGPALTSVYAEEMARQGVLCIGCGTALPDQFYQDKAPYIWGPQPTAEEFLVNVGDYVSKRLNGRPAAHAGGDLEGKPRKFGVVHFEQDPPVFDKLTELVAKCGLKTGYETAVTETYTFDVGKFGERSTTIIAKLKAEGVTSVIFLGDPIMPIYLTQQATAQNYFPEWIVTGTVLTDTTVLARKYDPQQWKHAFGLSNLPVRQPRESADAWRLHEWYFGKPPEAANTSGIIFSPFSQLFLGIHMAGPKLNAETFKQGMFNYPVSGGSAINPSISYGDHGFFKQTDPDTCDPAKVRPDYLGIDDVTEIWWDATATGPDEQGKTDVPGMWRYANNGKRYLPGTMPSTDADIFTMDNTVTVVEKAPADQAPPTYPPPARAS